MKHLKQDADFMTFLLKAKSCAGEVLLNTPNGDSLDLHSALCQMIAVVTMKKLRNIGSLEIQCENEQDYLLLREFLTD